MCTCTGCGIEQGIILFAENYPKLYLGILSRKLLDPPMIPVADPGFPVGGRRPVGGAPTFNVYAFQWKHAKMKELDPVGGCAPAVPPGSTNEFSFQ